MTNKLGRLLLCVLFAGLTTAWAVAQDDTNTKGMAHDTGATKARAEHGHLTVTEVHKVSGSCSQ